MLYHEIISMNFYSNFSIIINSQFESIYNIYDLIINSKFISQKQKERIKLLKVQLKFKERPKLNSKKIIILLREN